MQSSISSNTGSPLQAMKGQAMKHGLGTHFLIFKQSITVVFRPTWCRQENGTDSTVFAYGTEGRCNAYKQAHMLAQ